MKKIGWLLLAGLIILSLGCQSTEQVTLTKYFQAMKAKDRDTMASMAAEPIEIVHQSWKLVKVEPPVSEPLPLVKLLKDREDLKKQRELENENWRQKRDSLDILKQKITDARGRAKTDLEKQLPATEAAELEARKSFKAVIEKYQQLEKDIKLEKKIFNLSTGIEMEKAESFTEGTIETSVVLIQVVTPDGQTRNYRISLRKYIVEAGQTKRTGRMVIVKFAAE